MSIVLCFFVLLQSCAAGLGNALEANGEVSGSAGVLVAVMLLVGGIVAIATRNAKGKGGDIALIVLNGIGALMGYTLSGSYKDLKVWATWCLVCAVLAIVAIVKAKKTAEE